MKCVPPRIRIGGHNFAQNLVSCSKSRQSPANGPSQISVRFNLSIIAIHLIGIIKWKKQKGKVLHEGDDIGKRQAYVHKRQLNKVNLAFPLKVKNITLPKKSVRKKAIANHLQNEAKKTVCPTCSRCRSQSQPGPCLMTHRNCYNTPRCRNHSARRRASSSPLPTGR